jgi:hypothetical protein
MKTWQAILIVSAALAWNIVSLFIFERKVRRKLLVALPIAAIILFIVLAVTAIVIEFMP